MTPSTTPTSLFVLTALLATLQGSPGDASASRPATRPESGASHPATRPATPEAVARLIARLGPAQRGPKAPEKVNAFSAFLTLTPQLPDQNGVQVRGNVRFLDPRSFRFELIGEAQVAERMWDGTPRGFHQIERGGKSRPLTTKEDLSTREELMREARFSRQIVNLLYLDRAIAQFEEPQIADDPAYRRPGDKEPVPAVRVEGRLNDYPVHNMPEYQGPVHVTVWLAQDGLRPIAVRARPVPTTPMPIVVEEIQLFDFKRVADVDLPQELRLYVVDPRGSRTYQKQFKLANVTLNPKLTADDFRPAR